MTGSSPIGANSVVPMPKAPTASAINGQLMPDFLAARGR